MSETLETAFRAWVVFALFVAWFSYWEIISSGQIKKVTVVNFVPIFLAACALGLRWPVTVAERAAKEIARLDK